MALSTYLSLVESTDHLAQCQQGGVDGVGLLQPDSLVTRPPVVLTTRQVNDVQFTCKYSVSSSIYIIKSLIFIPFILHILQLEDKIAKLNDMDIFVKSQIFFFFNIKMFYFLKNLWLFNVLAFMIYYICFQLLGEGKINVSKITEIASQLCCKIIEITLQQYHK